MSVKYIRHSFVKLTVLMLAFLAGGCGLYNDYNLKNKYRLAGGEYYDGRMRPMEIFEGTLDLSTTTYTISYSFSFTKKDSTVISESKDETGMFSYTTEYETALFGSDEKLFSGYIFFTPPEETGSPWNRKYEYYNKSKYLLLDSYRNLPQDGYYVILRWEVVR